MDHHLWQKAAHFAARAHEGQKRKDDVTPYVAHPFRVAMTVRDVFGCDDSVALAAALLHDVIEDTDHDYDDIAHDYGEQVADCVAALSKDMRLPESTRESAYDEGLRQADWRAKLIKLADTYDNFCDPTGDPERVREKCRRAIEIAAPATEEHPAVARGVRAVEELLAGG